MKRILVGIDPGVNTGIAVLQDKNLALKCCNFWEACHFLETIINHAKSENKELKVYLEDPNQNKPTFQRKTNQKGMQKISQNVGSNKRDSQLLKEFLTERSVEVILCKPDKNSMTKTKPELFKKISGYEGRTNNHMRDAFFLISGK